MAQDVTNELLDIVAVHKFYLQLLQKFMGQSFPVPQEVRQPDIAPERHSQTLQQMKAWLRLLDMAITAPMMRDALKQQALPGETAEPLYRYYVFKSSPLDADRDKTDFLSTYLLRHPGPTAARRPGTTGGHLGDTYSYIYSQEQAQEFEKEIQQILGAPVSPLPTEHEQLLREFQFLHQEADEFRHFDQLMDSGILQRVRELKSHFGASFYHPQVLACSAVYNVFFGKRFDDLFHDATNQIKAFAAKVQQDGGSIMSRVDGDVTVKNLAEVEEHKILTQEYGGAKENFQKISRFKKAVDSRRSHRTASVPTPPPKSASAIAAAAAPPSRSSLPPTPPGVQSLAEAPGRGSGASNMMEETKVKGAVESIRNFVRAADAAVANIVPMRNGNILLTPAETEAFRADYNTEKSFRADYINAVCYMVALYARMQQEMEDYKSKRDSSYLWKPHADSLAYLLTASNRALQESAQVGVVAEQRGLTEKTKTMGATQDKLRGQISAAAQLLQS
ncbi:MAG TPA: hypothetical protein VK738_14780 [Terriglobales bacterium]|nr:hypothetical protein [Terriglobales bacterium]